MARRLTLTPQIAAQLVAAVRTGSNLVAAARSCGVAPSTAYDWLKRGEQLPRSACGELRRAVAEAQEQAREDQQRAVAKAARTEAGRRRRGFRVVRLGAEHPVEA